MGRRFQVHRFFRILRPEVGKRFLQYKDGEKAVRLGVVELQLGGALDGAGLFAEMDKSGVRQLDMYAAAAKHGTHSLLNQMVLWNFNEHAMLRVALPAAGNVGSQMLALTSGSGTSFSSGISLPSSTTVTAGWDEVVASVMRVAGGCGELCYVDAASLELRSFDESRSTAVDIQKLQDLILAGVLLSEETDFGEQAVRVNFSAVTWCGTAGLAQGTTSSISHVSGSTLQRRQHPKLTLMMLLSSRGWRPLAGRPAGKRYARGDELLYDVSPSRPKSYFQALALADQIFDRLAVLEADLPVIHHAMPSGYYQLLLGMKSAADAKALHALMDKHGDPSAIRNEKFLELLEGEDTSSSDGEVDEVIPRDLPMLLDIAPPALEDPTAADIKHVHKVISQVLRAVPAAMVDIRSRWACRGIGHQVHFDNASHSSGRQRAYITCPVAWHAACFRYTTVDLWESPAHAAAFLCCWADHATKQPRTWTKDNHTDFHPSAISWRAFVICGRCRGSSISLNACARHAFVAGRLGLLHLPRSFAAV